MTIENKISTGFFTLDKIMGLDRGAFADNSGSLICLAARPGMGKSALALDIALNVASTTNKEVVYFSLEMSGKQITDRLARKLSGFDASDKLNNLNLTVYDSHRLTPDDIEEILQKRDKPALVIIDYLGLMSLGKDDKTTSKSERYRYFCEIMRRLEEIKKRFQAPIIYLSQLKRISQRPVLSNLDYCDEIQQYSDIIAFLYREPICADNPHKTDSDITELIVAKNKYGECSTINLHFDGNALKFSE